MIKTSRLLLAAASFSLAATAALAADDKIVIGGALSMTGIQAPLDTPGYNGAQVAVKYLNDNGGVLGKQIEFINIDGKSDPVTVGNVAVELIDKGAQVFSADGSLSNALRHFTRRTLISDGERRWRASANPSA